MVLLWLSRGVTASSQKWTFFLDCSISQMLFSQLASFPSVTPLDQPSSTFMMTEPIIFSPLSYCYSSLYYEEVRFYFLSLLILASFQALRLMSWSSSFSVAIPRAMSFYLKSCRKRGLPRLLAKLFLAKVRRREGESKSPPIPRSLVYMKEMRPVRMVRIFQEELQVYLWQWVKVVQMGLPTSKRPFQVRNRILGGEKGQSSGSQSTPWQKPLAKSSSSPKRQKWKFRGSVRATSACWWGYFWRDCSSFWSRNSVIFLFI